MIYPPPLLSYTHNRRNLGKVKEKVCLNLRARFCCAMKIVASKRPVRVLVTLAVLQTQTCRGKGSVSINC